MLMDVGRELSCFLFLFDTWLEALMYYILTPDGLMFL
jgi:hypothetical protein